MCPSNGVSNTPATSHIHEAGAVTNGVTGTNSEHSAAKAPAASTWSSPGSAEFDFRSDVCTKPTTSMLEAIAEASLDDDVFREDRTTRDLESYIAELTGQEAALLVTSGTMGNQLCVRTHLKEAPYSVVADARSHVMGWEAGALSLLSSAFAIPVTPSNGHHLTLADIQKHTITSDDVHACPTKLICLENTLGGTILPLSSCESIARWARAQTPPIAVHLDGARLWDACAALSSPLSPQKTTATATEVLQAYSGCFESVSLCFSKGLGAPIGSIIVGKRPFIEKARHFRKAFGGGLRQSGVIAAAARVAVEDTFLGGRLVKGHERAREVAAMWVRKGGKLDRDGDAETGIRWLDLEANGVDEHEWVRVGLEEGVRLLGRRVVGHYQISEEAVRRLGRCMDRVLGDGRGGGKGQGDVLEGGRLEREAEKLMKMEAE